MPIDATQEAQEPRMRPISNPDCSLSDSELRETAYEILLAACRSSGSRPLTYVSQSEVLRQSSMLRYQAGAPAPASTMNETLGLRVSNKSTNSGGNTNMAGARKSLSVAELIRVQMGIGEQADSRIRRALLRIAAGQLGRRVESMVLPLEFLQQLKLSDFPNQREHEIWQRRNLNVLEVGLVLSPHTPLDSSSSSTVQQLREIAKMASKKPLEAGRSNEMKLLASAVTSLASRPPRAAVCHWADGYPMSFRLYKPLLEALFDPDDPTALLEEADRVMDLVKKTWPVIGIDLMLHRLFLARTLLDRFTDTGEADPAVLVAAGVLLDRAVGEAEGEKNHERVVRSSTEPVLTWADARLSSYRGYFDRGNSELMHGFISLRVSAARVLSREEGEDPMASRVVDGHIRSSVSSAFAQEMEACTKKKRSGVLPVLSVLAQEVNELMYEEKEVFSPILRAWHPNPAGVAAATLHSCFGKELKRFVSAVTELTPDVVHVMIAANKLEADLVGAAVEESADSEDGGKGVVCEMDPYEVDAVISTLVGSWIETRVERIAGWVDRNLELEEWNPRSNKERVGPSAVEILRSIDETLEAFFLLPITIHPTVLLDLLRGLDGCLQSYILKSRAGCGRKGSYMPAVPPLTRCGTGPKFGVFKKKEKPDVTSHKRKPESVGPGRDGGGRFSILQLCVRINTMNHIRKAVAVFGSRVGAHMRAAKYPPRPDGGEFDLSLAACREGVCQLSEGAADKVVFGDLSHVLLDGLYVGGAHTSRIGMFLQELDYHLEIVSAVVDDRVRTRVITDMMKAAFDGFLAVLLAGGPSRVFGQRDGPVVEEDFVFLTELFWSGGDGLPADLIDRFAAPAKSVLPLFGADTDELIAELRARDPEGSGEWLGRAPEKWDRADPGTIGRVLCHRDDVKASKFLKKTYGIPKK